MLPRRRKPPLRDFDVGVACALDEDALDGVFGVFGVDPELMKERSDTTDGRRFEPVRLRVGARPGTAFVGPSASALAARINRNDPCRCRALPRLPCALDNSAGRCVMSSSVPRRSVGLNDIASFTLKEASEPEDDGAMMLMKTFARLKFD